MKVIIISGPTATGKTDIGIELAQHFGGEIVNFDSLLLYREITIGTAKPSLKEREKVIHHMIDVASIKNPLNAADYAKIALPLIKNLHQSNKIVYLIGGSGFYLQALVQGMYDSPTTPQEIILRSDNLYQKEGIKPFLDILKREDFSTYSRYHENDHYRIRRAVEHFWNTGIPLSVERSKKEKENQDRNEQKPHGWDILHLHLDVPKEEHLEIIKNRTDKMLEGGLIEEVKSLLDQGFSGLEKPLQSIGYKEVLDFHFGVLKTRQECRERIIISTRQLAKSQRTWFNRLKNKECYHPLNQRELIYRSVSHFLGL